MALGIIKHAVVKDIRFPTSLQADGSDAMVQNKSIYWAICNKHYY